MDTIVILFILIAISGGAIGIARYSIDEEDRKGEPTFYRFLAYFILNAAIGVVGGIVTKFTISSSLEAILGGGIVSALIGYEQVRKLLFDAIIKRYYNDRTNKPK